MSKKIFTGIIPIDEEKQLVFSAQPDDFVFTFMSDTVNSMFSGIPPIKMPSEDGFIFGKTHSNHNIAIYLGNKDFKVYGASALRTSAYIKSSSNVYDQDLLFFNGIVFSGGTLNSVFRIQGLNITHTADGAILKPKDDEIKYQIDCEDGNMDISIRSVVSENFGVKGHSITNNNVALEIHFDSAQPLSSFFHHYNKIKDILSFLTFRYNVGFEKINLQTYDSESDGFSNMATTHIRIPNP